MVGRGMQRQGEVIPVIAPKQEVHNAQSSAHRWKICPLLCTLYNVFYSVLPLKKTPLYWKISPSHTSVLHCNSVLQR